MFAVEQVDAHVGQAVAAAAGDAVGIDPGRIGPHQVEILVGLRLLQEADHAAGIVQPHDAHAPSRRRLETGTAAMVTSAPLCMCEAIMS